jgi:hypothetical protein
MVENMNKNLKAIKILNLLEWFASRHHTVNSRHSDAYHDMIYRSREILEHYDDKEYWGRM